MTLSEFSFPDYFLNLLKELRIFPAPLLQEWFD
jgi:hypothetical protein